MWTRREVLALMAVSARAEVRYRDYSACWPDYLRQRAEAAYRKRRAAIEALTSQAAVTARAGFVRDTFWRLAGGLPERTPLNARTTKSFARQGYRVENVIYESFPGIHIPANVYIPAGDPPFPGVLLQMGHSLNGKAYTGYQRCAQGLVRLGFLVLAFDPMGQGERVYYPARDLSRTRLASADDEHTLPGRQMLLFGDTSTRFQTWDAIRSLDYLAAHPLVDPARLASTGQSGGGTLTMMLACADDRLAAAFVSMGNTENFACRNFNPPGSTDDAEQNFVGSGPAGFDRWDLLYPMAPKPLCIQVSAKDFFGTYSPSYMESGREEYAALERVYRVMGAADRIAWGETGLPHGMALDTRLAIYSWFTRWLQGRTSPVTAEPPTAPEEDRVLFATESGSTTRSLNGDSPFSRNRQRQITRRVKPLAEVLGVPGEPSRARFHVLHTAPGMSGVIVGAELESEPGVWVPAWIFRPASSVQQPALLALDSAGRNARWREGDLYQQLAASGQLVCAPDVRGIGDLAPAYGRGAASYARSHNSEENWAWASLILGTPLLSQRVTDIRAAASALRAMTGAPVRVAARGPLCVPALCAAALEPDIASLYLTGMLATWRHLVDEEEYTHTFANFLPGVLLHTDLPEIAAGIGPRPVTLAGLVDAAGRPVFPEEAAKLYTGANIRIAEEGGWTVAALA
ncbi:MAG: acetylxylan esterase [Bryobacterales bacterium]|nr:acetylxylan esterase [Bryobacterales bacterium]